ncbi:hypothetical protein ACOYR1_17875 [Thalassotalea piscium]
MKFNEHGHFSIQNNGAHLIIDATGPFNLQVMNSFQRSLVAHTQDLSKKSWGQIIIMNGTSIFTPEAEQHLCETLVTRQKHGLFFSAVVHCHAQYKHLIEHQLSKCYQQYAIRHAFFDDIKTAKTYLKQLNMPHKTRN